MTISYDKLALNHQILLDLPFNRGEGILCPEVAKPHHSVVHAGKPTLPAWASEEIFEIGPKGGAAKWSGLDFHSGRQCVFVSDGGFGIDWGLWTWGKGCLEFTMDMLLADLDPDTLSYWFKTVPPLCPEHPYAFPYMCFDIDSTGGHVKDKDLVLHSGPDDWDWYPPQGVWTQWSNACGWDSWHCELLRGTIAEMKPQLPNARLLNVAIQVGITVDAEVHPDPHIPISAFIDDICINGETYSLKPPVTPATLASGLGVLEFKGLSEYLQLLAASCADLDFTSEDYSIGCWFNAESGGADDKTLIGRFLVNDSGWELYHYINEILTLRHHHAAGASSHSACYSAGWAFGTWHFMGVSRSGASAIFYRNGVALTTTCNGGLIDPETCNQNLYIGNDTTGVNLYKGKLWRPRVWGRALSASEWAQIFERERHWFGV